MDTWNHHGLIPFIWILIRQNNFIFFSLKLLGRVIRMEKSDLETERLRLVEDVLEHRATMKELEDNLLEKLTSVEGSLVDDEELIIVLQDTKQTAEEVSKKLTVASETETKINTARFGCFL